MRDAGCLTKTFADFHEDVVALVGGSVSDAPGSFQVEGIGFVGQFHENLRAPAKWLSSQGR